LRQERRVLPLTKAFAEGFAALICRRAVKEVSMPKLSWMILAAGTFLAAAPATAQTYDPSYPVCLHVYGRIVYYECAYTSLAQCNMSASGRAAQCIVNPFYAGAQRVPPRRRHRHPH
jgi:drug/metabolite transporter (DMT)-like permease